MTRIYPILSITIFLNVEFYDDIQMRNVTLCYKLPPPVPYGCTGWNLAAVLVSEIFLYFLQNLCSVQSLKVLHPELSISSLYVDIPCPDSDTAIDFRNPSIFE